MVQIKTSGGVSPSLRHVFKKPFGLPSKEAPNFRASETTHWRDLEEADFRSYLGTPVYTQIEFEAGRYFEITDTARENPIDYEGVILQTVLAEVTQSKNIITTAIQGRDGTVKEYISKGDYLITLTGAVIGETVNGNITDIQGYYPDVDVRRLIRICDVPGTIKITNEFLDFFGIHDVVITSHNMNQLAGSRDVQPFSISLLSDNPIELDELTTTKIINIQTRVPAEPIISLNLKTSVPAEPIISLNATTLVPGEPIILTP